LRLLALNYAYCSNGAQQCATGNTGSPWQQTIAIGGQTVAVQEYKHDSLNRVWMAEEKAGGTSFTPICPDSGSVRCQTFGYDAAGNRTVAAQTNFTATGRDASGFSSATNRISDTGWGHDAAGDIAQDRGRRLAGLRCQRAGCIVRLDALPV
jgi:hypothetical protein